MQPYLGRGLGDLLVWVTVTDLRQIPRCIHFHNWPRFPHGWGLGFTSLSSRRHGGYLGVDNRIEWEDAGMGVDGVI